MVALKYENMPIVESHGGPIRMVVPDKYFYKSLKWLERIDVLQEDRLGRWETEAGYHNEADPWREQRYIAPNLDRFVLKEALARRDFSNLDFHSLNAVGLDLAGLNARGALLRATNFTGVNLEGSCFDSANLSNARLEYSNLRNATFVNADVEGANFCGADLRGADFSGASLFGSSFYPYNGPGDAANHPAWIDHSTRIDRPGLEALTPLQKRYVGLALRKA
jgi:hypothetical protein